MTTLASLDEANQQAGQALEQERGLLLLAFSSATQDEAPPEYTAHLKPAQLDPETIERLPRLEQQTNSLILAFEPLPE